jgi:tRNA(Arg) A34 adenosine deaminase TadA
MEYFGRRNRLVHERCRVRSYVSAMSDARSAYDALDRPWQLALDEAWISWRRGSAGVGAVISDSAGHIAALGRNRMLEPRAEPGVLASTAIAHAEMNALALLPLGPTDDLTITTTFEPCLMCASTIVQANIPHVRYAAADPLFDGMNDWFADLPFAHGRVPSRTELGGPIGAFTHVLHLSWMSFWAAGSIEVHRAVRPQHLELADEIAKRDHLGGVAQDDGDVVDAMAALWPRLLELSPPA